MSNSKETYRGKAVIMNVELEAAEDWFDWERKHLSEADLQTAFKVVYDCAERDANGARHSVKVEISHRELSGKMLEYYKREDGSTPTQIDVALRSLKAQGLVAKTASTEADIAPALDDSLCGREVTIRVTEDMKPDGTYWPAKAVFASPFVRISGDEKMARLATFRTGKPLPPKASSAPTAVAVPAPSDADDMPF